MSTLTRKQREIQEREQRILAVARTALLEQGYLGLSMDAIAAHLEYSKGTIYNHFPCKEEIIIALALETNDKRLGMFERAAAWPGLPRERMAAVGVAAELFVRLFPGHFRVEQLVRSTSIWEKTSNERREVMRSCETRCVGLLAGIVRDAIAQGHLTLPDGMSPEDLVFGLWAQTFGAYAIMATSENLQLLGVTDPYVAVRTNINRMLDGFGWAPTSDVHPYPDLFERVSNEVFPDECQRAGG
ncbi:MAG: TetR/AcrR family transcriptional regulator [Maioricimonas sp. JB045]|uniref:TetR/AcrR family transcriptional regulator n=1 Tax=Maioricimonas sp. JC845 TaxID=3232138 RepID=UPI003457E2AF